MIGNGNTREACRPRPGNELVDRTRAVREDRVIVQVPRPQRRAPRDRAWGRVARREVARRLLRRARAGLPRLRGHRHRATHLPAPSSSCWLSRACEHSSLPLSPPILHPLSSPWKAPASQHRFVQLLYPLWRHRFSRTDGVRSPMRHARPVQGLRPCARHDRRRSH